MESMKISSQSYHDFAGLGELKARVRNDDESAAREVGQKFEAMFIQMMLKSAREANEPLKTDLMGSSAQDTFEEMYHQELSQVMSQRGTFGLAEWLTDTLNQQSGGGKAISSYQQSASMPLNNGTQAPMSVDTTRKPMTIKPGDTGR